MKLFVAYMKMQYCYYREFCIENLFTSCITATYRFLTCVKWSNHFLSAVASTIPNDRYVTRSFTTGSLFHASDGISSISRIVVFLI